MHMVQVAKPSVNLSWVTGASFNLPLFTTAQLDTTAELGVFWEVDLRDGFDSGNHFLITTGFNVLSLFGATPGPGGG
jgi:hypothetical protein